MAVAEPAAEGRGRLVAPAVPVAAAELVRDVPEGDRGVLPVALGESAGDPERVSALMDHHLDAVAERARIVATPPRERDLGRLLAPYIEAVDG